MAATEQVEHGLVDSAGNLRGRRRGWREEAHREVPEVVVHLGEVVVAGIRRRSVAGFGEEGEGLDDLGYLQLDSLRREEDDDAAPHLVLTDPPRRRQRWGDGDLALFFLSREEQGT